MVDEGQTPEHGYTISSPCEPDDSGELKSIQNYTACKQLKVCGKEQVFCILFYNDAKRRVYGKDLAKKQF